MTKVAICIVVRDSYPETTLFLKSLVKSIQKVDARINILDWGSTDERAINFCKEVVKVTNGSMGTIAISASIGQAYDAVTAFIDDEDEFICFLKPNVFLSEGWLLNLIYHYDTIDNSGLVGIRSNSDPCAISFLPTDSHFDRDFGALSYLEEAANMGALPVWGTKTNIIDAPAFISKKNFDILGGFTKNFFNEDFYFEELSYRAAINGMQNYYVNGSSCVKTSFKNDFIFPPTTHDGLVEFKCHIDKLFKKQKKK